MRMSSLTISDKMNWEHNISLKTLMQSSVVLLGEFKITNVVAFLDQSPH